MFAERVATGNYSDKIEVRGQDELSRLLRSLATMQLSLQTQVEAEQASREREERIRTEQEDAKKRMMAELAAAGVEELRSAVDQLQSEHGEGWADRFVDFYLSEADLRTR